jgi:HSP20 family protein
MRLASIPSGREEVDDLFTRFFGDGNTFLGRSTPLQRASGFDVPTDVFSTADELVIRMDLPGVAHDDVEVTMQDSVLVINGTRSFPYHGDDVRFLRRGTSYGDFTQRVSLGKGLKLDAINARFADGVLEVKIPYAEEVQPRKIEIEAGGSRADGTKEISA